MSVKPRMRPSEALTVSFVALAEALLPTDGFCDWPAVQGTLSAAARAHTQWSTVAGQLEREPGAARLLQPEGFQASTGLGFECLTAPTLLDSLLLATWQRMDITGQRGSRRRIGYTARTILSDLCALAAGGVVDLPARILWDGPELDADRRLHGAFGSLRWEEDVTPPYMEGMPYRGLMLYTKLPVEITELRSAADPSFYGSSNVTQRGVDRIISQVQLALLDDGSLEPEDSPYESTSGPPARVALVDISTPWDSGRFMSASIDEFAASEMISNPRAVERRLNFYVTRWRCAVDLAARRLAASADQQRRVDDALVDAVTAWESLLGGSEISFRVTASMARMLRSEFRERQALYTELNKIYKLRSQIVHGAKDVSIDDAARVHDRRLRATEVGAQVLRQLLGTRRDLLDCNAEDRSIGLLLGSSADVRPPQR